MLTTCLAVKKKKGLNKNIFAKVYQIQDAFIFAFFVNVNKNVL